DHGSLLNIVVSVKLYGVSRVTVPLACRVNRSVQTPEVDVTLPPSRLHHFAIPQQLNPFLQLDVSASVRVTVDMLDVIPWSGLAWSVLRCWQSSAFLLQSPPRRQT